jgi:hypothetical protein
MDDLPNPLHRKKAQNEENEETDNYDNGDDSPQRSEIVENSRKNHYRKNSN